MNQDDLYFKALTTQETKKIRSELQNLAVAAYGTHAGVLTPANAETMRNNILKEDTWNILLSNSKCFVCLDKDRITGMAYLIPSGNPWKFFEKEWSCIRMVGVLPGYEGKGIAKKLTRMCIDLAKENKERIIALHTSEYMHAARHIYEGFGFKILKEIEPQWGKRYWIYTLELNT
jgi:GNAT superfamily N-acetyltransferase